MSERKHKRHRPTRQDAENSLNSWADVLVAGTANAEQLRDLAGKLRRVAARESWRIVFANQTKLPRGRQPTPDADIKNAFEALIAGESQAAAARAAGLPVTTLMSNLRREKRGTATTAQAAGETLATGEVIMPIDYEI